ncbi:hypothetical protein Cch01nite_09320 [Cellulomonas chitinilytica]|uniref:ABC transporter n=1 Tax=Cellulomonas chitinilytica TaxID=398759 RepID=A0A919NYX4_9CELL|nr:hypothetical protein [Cellulomonas chitinilytica]GIG20208.1 hypothetical protein Cch01nite_09320 [Cellulomonas chitinilytica]
MTLRGVDLVPLLAGCALGSVILAGCVVAADDSPPLTFVRLALVALAAAAAWILDDPAAAAVDAVPRTRLRRTLARSVALAVPLSVWVVAVVALDLRSTATPAGALLVEGAGILTITVALAAMLRFAGRDEPGDVAATVVCAAMVALIVFPHPWSAHVFPVEDGWTGSSVLWSALGAAAAAVVVAASRDPARRDRRPIAAHREEARGL